MARPLRILYPGACYHITCRGNEKKKIFRDPRDREIFLKKLALSTEIYGVSLLAYVCMPNHFHLLVKTPRGNLPEFMRHFNVSYTGAFNHRHKRVGHLYQGRYKAFLIDADSYLLEVSRYVHLNPARAAGAGTEAAFDAWRDLLRYQWSSLPGYCSVARRKGFIDYRVLLNYLGGDNAGGRRAYCRFVARGLDEGLANPLALARGHGVVGEEEFINRIKSRGFDRGVSPREQPAVRILHSEYEPGELIERYCRMIGTSRTELCRRGRRTVERSMLMELLYRFCPITQAEIGELMGGIDYSAVSVSRKRFRRQLEEDSSRRREFEEKLAKLNKVKSRVKI